MGFGMREYLHLFQGEGGLSIIALAYAWLCPKLLRSGSGQESTSDAKSEVDSANYSSEYLQTATYNWSNSSKMAATFSVYLHYHLSHW